MKPVRVAFQMADCIPIQHQVKKEMIMAHIIVKGMSCDHCRQAVTKALEGLPGVTSVTVDLASGEASWTESQPVDRKVVEGAIQKIGFEVQ